MTRLQGRHGSSRSSRRHAAGQRRRRWSQPPAVPAAGRLIRGAWPGRSAARSGQWLPAGGRGRAAEPIIIDRRRRGASGGGEGTRPMSTPPPPARSGHIRAKRRPQRRQTGRGTAESSESSNCGAEPGGPAARPGLGNHGSVTELCWLAGATGL